MFDMHNHNTAQDETNSRVYIMSNGNKVHLKRVDPHGFVYISLNKGPLPDHLTGAYTSFRMAKAAIEGYLIQKNITIKEP